MIESYNLIMITTHQDNLHIYKLIDSVKSNKNIKVLLVIVSQESKIDCNSENDFLTIHFIDQPKMSLSKARNIALDFLIKNNVSSEYIMFPDDDTSFDDTFFNNFTTILGSNKCYITPIYNEGTKNLYMGKYTPNGMRILMSNLRLIGSPNQIILYDKLKSQIVFNEKLGVGTEYGSSEDLDVFIKLFRSGNDFYFINDLYNYHPKKVSAYQNVSLKNIVKRFKGYSFGFAYIIFKYRLFRLIPEYLIRTFVAFFVFSVRFQFKLALAYILQFFIRIIIILKFIFNKHLYK